MSFVVRTLLLNIAVVLVSAAGNKTHAQPYNSINYRWEQGFTASAGYNIKEDKNGYIWIGTENGLMRFNGHDFKTYTTLDGLSDNEVVNMEVDSRGRLWLFPFTNSICFVDHGKIHNAANNAFLKTLRPSGWLSVMLEDRNGTLWFSEGKGRLLSRDTAGRSRYYVVDNSRGFLEPWLDASRSVLWMSRFGNGKLFRYNGTRFVPVPQRTPHLFHEHGVTIHADMFFDKQCGLLSFYKVTASGIVVTKRVKTRIFSVRAASERVGNDLFTVTDNGVYRIDIRTGTVSERFLPDCRVGAFCQASDGALWFGTIGQGIFRFIKTPVRTLKTTIAHPFISSIKGTDSGMCCVTSRSRLMTAKHAGNDGYIQDRELFIAEPETPYCPYTYVAPTGNGTWQTCGYDMKSIQAGKHPVVRYHNLKETFKAVAEYDKDQLVAATIGGAYFIDRNTGRFRDSFMTGMRTSAIAVANGMIYVGTFAGVYARYPDGRCEEIKASWSRAAGRILALCPGKDKLLWVAGSRELVAIQDGRVVSRFRIGKDLPCNRISCMKTSGNVLWVGTDKGLFAISDIAPYKILRNITYTTGLASNQVTCIDIHKGCVWVGTVDGINYFEETDLFRSSGKASIIINGIMNGNRLLYASKTPLKLEDKPLTIEFDAVDFSGGARPVFEYRINERGAWIPLEGNSIYFPVLPAGRFTLSLKAFSPNWSEHRLFRQEFYNPVPYYRTVWFTLLLAVAGLVAAGLLMWLAIWRVRRVYAQKLGIQQNLLRLEQMALQGQMNPHFIFNCIAALKQYYNDGDRQQANSFVDSFSRLIRQTFEMGTETFVSLEKELGYLSLYLEVEKIRFDNSFCYKVDLHTHLLPADIPVPAMLLQPLVENAIRHGIRHLPEQDGVIHITIEQQDGEVGIIIADNGIGIRKSMEMKKQTVPDCLSSSIVNSKRIAILNRLFAGKIIFRIDEIASGGTRVTLRYPVNIKQHIIL